MILAAAFILAQGAIARRRSIRRAPKRGRAGLPLFTLGDGAALRADCLPGPAGLVAIQEQGYTPMGAGTDTDGDLTMLWLAGDRFLVTIRLKDGRIGGILKGDNWQGRSKGNPA